MTRFRPCIDLHAGQVKQIVGGTLSTIENDLKTNHVSTLPAGYFADLYREKNALGAHVIMLGPGNEQAAMEALSAWPGHLQIGGGITDENAKRWIDAGAEKVVLCSSFQRPIITAIKSLLKPLRSYPRYLNGSGMVLTKRLRKVLTALGDDRDKLVIDLSCRRRDGTWFVAMNKWQTLTEMEITQDSIKMLEPYCSEFLIHAADNEGLQRGIDRALVSRLAEWCSIPITYAGGGRGIHDLDLVESCSGGKVDLTIGSALDVFGGTGATFEDCIRWNNQHGS